MRTAYSYIRFSTPEQLQGRSLERQLETTAAFAKRNGWKLDTSLSFKDLGRSGFKASEQKELAAFLEAVKDGTVESGSVLIVEHLDRLSRQQVSTALRLFMDIIEAGVDVATLNPEQIHTSKTINEGFGLMLPLMQFAVAHEESAKKSWRAKDNWARKRKSGSPMTSRCPAWVTLKKGEFVLAKEKVRWVKRIYEWCRDGYGARAITKKLNEKNVPNIALGTSKVCKDRWTQNYVELLLRTKAVIGEYQPYKTNGSKRVPFGDPIRGYFPEAITEELYYAAQAAKASRRKQQGRIGERIANLFQGILFDARTGSSMRLVNSSKTDKAAGTRRRLASYAADLGQAEFMSWKYEHFEEMFLRFIVEVTQEHARPTNSADPIPGLEAKREELAARVKKLQDRIAQEPDFDALLDVLKRAADEKKELEKRIADEKTARESAKTGSQDVLNAWERLSFASDDEQEPLRAKLKASIRLLVKEVWVLMETHDGITDKVVRTCTVQVFFHDGKIRTFWIGRFGHTWVPGAPYVVCDGRDDGFTAYVVVRRKVVQDVFLPGKKPGKLLKRRAEVEADVYEPKAWPDLRVWRERPKKTWLAEHLEKHADEVLADAKLTGDIWKARTERRRQQHLSRKSPAER